MTRALLKVLLKEAQINILKISFLLEQSRCSETQFVEMRVENDLKRVKQQILHFILKCSNLGLSIDRKRNSTMSKMIQ
jgi:DNA-directed RNA polymerase V subunit 1